MKLSVNFDALWANVNKMGDVTIEDFSPKSIWENIEGATGEVKLKDIEPIEDLLSVDGHQILLFIPDHGRWVSGALQTPGRGNKFHIADCETLEKMRQAGRYQRYMATNRLSDIFHIYGINDTGQEVSGEAQLHVCKLCLKQLNYKGAANSRISERNHIVQTFDIKEFFTTYSSLFKKLPRTFVGKKSGYSNDWKAVSLRLRQAAHYTCSACHVNLSDNRDLLHVHHINGTKHDNSAANLQVLCAACHQQQPLHDHLCIAHPQMQTITRLRRKQGILHSSLNWDEVFLYADSALHGVLDHAQKKHHPPPEIGYPLTESIGKIITELDIAWPDKKYGISILPLAATDWTIHGIRQAMVYFDG